MDLDIAIQKFLKYRLYIQKIHKNTISIEKWVFKRFNEFIFVKYSRIVSLDEIKLDDFIEYAEFLETAEFKRWKNNAKKIKLSYNTQIIHQHKIRTFFKWCHLSWFMEKDFGEMPIWKFKGNKNLSLLSKEEIKQFIELAKNKKNRIRGIRDELLFRIAYFTWLRRNEILNLTFKQILSDDQFQIVWKMNKSRTVFFDDDSKIKQLALELRYLYQTKLNIDFNDQNDFVFRSTVSKYHGEKLWRWTIFLIIKDYKEKLWIKRRLTIHSFRHTFATTLLENWANLFEVQTLLWHSNISSTQIYTHISTTKLKECSQLLHLS